MASSKDNKMLYAIGAFVVIALLIGGGIFFYNKIKDNDDKEESTGDNTIIIPVPSNGSGTDTIVIDPYARTAPMRRRRRRR